MAPVITLYILAGCVAAAAALFVVMIVLSALRPPQLPELSLGPPPLQRMMRALTPLPVATAPAIPSRMFDEAPTTTMPRSRQAKAFAIPPMPPGVDAASAARTAAPAARPAPAPPPIPKAAPPTFAPPQRSAPAFAPTAPSFAPPPAPSFTPPAPALAPSPFVWEMPGSAPPAFVPPPAKNKARADLQRRPISLPRYPKRSRKLLRFIIALFVFSTLSAGAAVAYPSLLDPLCDDYEWFGGDATQVVREYARDAHAAIYDFIREL